jgi:hypothetical protein
VPDPVRDAAVAAAAAVRRLPYAWPAPPDADAAERDGVGSCASKHALLARRLDAVGVPSLPLLAVGPLVPAVLAGDPDLAEGADLVEVHECLTVLTPWAGPVRVDVTWDPPLVARGLPGGPWDGWSDTPLAVGDAGPGWAVPRDGLRAAKEGLRRRLYGPGERDVRDRVLAALSRRLAAWRG